MKILADFHNVISHNPAFFKMLGETNDLYVITGCTDELRLRKIERSYLQFIPHKAFIYRKQKIDRNCDNFNAEKNWRLRRIKEIKPDIYFDDSNNICNLVMCQNHNVQSFTATADYSEICWHVWDKPGHCKLCKKYWGWAKP